MIIKDNDYYIQGSFNFLSFNKEKGQKIANEESILVPNNAELKWKKTLKEYGITHIKKIAAGVLNQKINNKTKIRTKPQLLIQLAVGGNFNGEKKD